MRQPAFLGQLKRLFGWLPQADFPSLKSVYDVPDIVPDKSVATSWDYKAVDRLVGFQE